MKIKFWHEVWIGECPFRIKHGRLFSICNQKEWEVSKVLGVQINLTFRRNFDALEWNEWGQMVSELTDIELTTEKDSIRWALTPHGQFTMHSLYVHWSFPEVRDLKMEELWHSKLPLKTKNFLWLVLRNRVHIADNLGRKNGKVAKYASFVRLGKM
jgi:hypothetical protein